MEKKNKIGQILAFELGSRGVSRRSKKKGYQGASGHFRGFVFKGFQEPGQVSLAFQWDYGDFGVVIRTFREVREAAFQGLSKGFLGLFWGMVLGTFRRRSKGFQGHLNGLRRSIAF